MHLHKCLQLLVSFAISYMNVPYVQEVLHLFCFFFSFHAFTVLHPEENEWKNNKWKNVLSFVLKYDKQTSIPLGLCMYAIDKWMKLLKIVLCILSGHRFTYAIETTEKLNYFVISVFHHQTSIHTARAWGKQDGERKREGMGAKRSELRARKNQFQRFDFVREK